MESLSQMPILEEVYRICDIAYIVEVQKVAKLGGLLRLTFLDRAKMADLIFGSFSDHTVPLI